MKKLLFTIVMAAMSATSLLAQQSGDRSFGFTGGFSFSDEENVPNTFVAGIEGQLGFFFVNNFKIGIDAVYAFDRQNVDNVGNFLTHVWGLGPLVSYYVKITDKLYYTPEIIGDFTWGTLYLKQPQTKYSYGRALSKEGNLKGKSISLVPFQIEFHPTERVGITASICAATASYLEYTDDPDEVHHGGYKINFGLNPTVGIVFYLSREKSSM